MTISMHSLSIPILEKNLGHLSKFIDKAAAYCEQKKCEPAALITFRLYPDMLPFSRQIQIACDQAKGCAARLAAIDPPKFEDTETTFAELQARIERTISFIRGVSREAIDASAGREIAMKIGPNEIKLSGQKFLTEFALPNFFFHVTAAYIILRHNGVELGKRDYIGSL